MTIHTFMPLIVLFIFAVIFKTILATKTKNYDKTLKEIVDEEHLASFSRAKDLPTDFFRKIDTNFIEQKIFDSKPDQIKILYNNFYKKNGNLIAIPPFEMSNLTIKKNYGLQNLENLIDAEENYYNYINSINSLANALITEKDFELAETLLLYSIKELNSNLLKSYQLIFDLYEKISDIEKATDLKNYINNSTKIEDNIRKKIK